MHCWTGAKRGLSCRVSAHILTPKRPGAGHTPTHPCWRRALHQTGKCMQSSTSTAPRCRYGGNCAWLSQQMPAKWLVQKKRNHGSNLLSRCAKLEGFLFGTCPGFAKISLVVYAWLIKMHEISQWLVDLSPCLDPIQSLMGFPSHVSNFAPGCMVIHQVVWVIGKNGPRSPT